VQDCFAHAPAPPRYVTMPAGGCLRALARQGALRPSRTFISLARPRHAPTAGGRILSRLQDSKVFHPLVGNIANIFGLVALSMSEMLYLRCFSLCSGVCNITYMLTQRTPLLLPACWSAVFFSLNVYHVARILRERNGVQFSEEEMALYNQAFGQSGLSIVEFARLMRKAEWSTLCPGAAIVEQGKPVHRISLITEGSSTLSINGEPLGLLRANDFVGDIQYLNTDEDQAEAKVTVVVEERSRVVRWEWRDLRALSSEDKKIGTVIDRKLSRSVIGKLGLVAHRADGKNGEVSRLLHSYSARKSDPKAAYLKVLEGVLSDGVISEDEECLVHKFRELQKIDDATHTECLNALGWTHDEFRVGSKQTRPCCSAS